MKNKVLVCLALLSGLAVQALAQHPNPTISYLEIYDVESRTHRVIKEFPFVVEAPNWTPDGKWLVVNRGGKLYKIAPDGSTDLQEINTRPTASIVHTSTSFPSRGVNPGS